MADPVAWTVAERSWAVIASDGKEVGRLDEVLGDAEADIFDGISVGAGAVVLDRPKYVPAEQVGGIEEGTVHLTIDSETFGRLGPYHAGGSG